MSMKPAAMQYLHYDFIPQAEISYPVDDLRNRLDLIYDHDDLDEFIGGAFFVDEDFYFTIKHYKGHPKDIFTIYFDRVTPSKALSYVEKIMFNLDIPEGSRKWSRSSSPEL